MALARGRFGIEYDPNPRREDSSGFGWVVVLVLVVFAVSLAVHTVRRHKAEPDAPPPGLQGPVAILPPGTSEPDGPAATDAPDEDASPRETESAPPPPPPPPRIGGEAINRPPKVKNLLLRLDEAERQGNIELAVSTIEQLRALPGEPAADLDDSLARRLGELNTRWLFERANKQWVVTVKVRSGESATRLALAYGTTLASLVKLNGLENADHLRSGQTIKIMNHPRFSLTVHRRARYADLHLNGKFFKRYDIEEDVTGKVGAYTLETKLRTLFKTLGLAFALRDSVELETLLPKGAAVIISET